jgi:hypothetical protein
MRWIALLAAALVASALPLLLVLPPASDPPAPGVRASLDRTDVGDDGIQLARSDNGHKSHGGDAAIEAGTQVRGTGFPVLASSLRPDP